jgi:glycosyltransferase involved in cell wall biosynthesis
LRRLARRIAFDFDDALYAPRSRPLPEHLALARKLAPKLDTMLEAADLAVVGNLVLADYARLHCPRVVVIPTAFDASRAPMKQHRQAAPAVIGWIGSEGTLTYLDMLVPVLARLARERPEKVILRVICNVPFRAPKLEGMLDNREWSIDRETQDVLSFDIGVMPLFDDEWSRGKCGFKALQMMAHALPVVASPVGANCEIVEDGVNGFLADGEEAWVSRLGELLDSPALRQTIGERGRATVAERYSVEGAAENLVSALNLICRTRDRSKVEATPRPQEPGPS